LNDPVLRVLASRQVLADEGYSRGLLLSGAAHVFAFVSLLIVVWLTPKTPPINAPMVQMIALPRGGAAPVAVPKTEKAPEPPSERVAESKPKEPPAPAAAPKFIKPPTEVAKKGVAPVDQKRSVKDRPVESQQRAVEKVPSSQPTRPAAVPTPGTGGDDPLQIAPSPGTFDGQDGVSGALAFYLAAAKNKIWANWARQIRPDFSGSVRVTFTIHRDGSIDQIQVLDSSGSSAIDRLAERALLSTQLGPLPTSYEKETLVVNATFKPAS
jgi:periplasmic protein TonB